MIGQQLSVDILLCAAFMVKFTSVLIGDRNLIVWCVRERNSTPSNEDGFIITLLADARFNTNKQGILLLTDTLSRKRTWQHTACTCNYKKYKYSFTFLIHFNSNGQDDVK